MNKFSIKGLGFIVCMIIAAGIALRLISTDPVDESMQEPEAWATGGQIPATLQQKEGSVTVMYTTFGDDPVFLSFDATTGRVSIRIKPDPGAVFGVPDDSLVFLKAEVIRLTSDTKTIPLAEGYSLQFTGGYPTWAPYFASLKDGVYRGLMFAEHATITPDKVIVVQGGYKKPDGYYPYLASE
jgi:hypothetical protein